jgi:hypothetical protein
MTKLSKFPCRRQYRFRLSYDGSRAVARPLTQCVHLLSVLVYVGTQSMYVRNAPFYISCVCMHECMYVCIFLLLHGPLLGVILHALM